MIVVSCLPDANEYKQYFDIELVKIIFLYREIRNYQILSWLDYESILTNVVKEAKGNGDKRIGIVSNQKYKIKRSC